MKKYLLDSHTLIWAIADDDKLPRPILDLLQDKACPLFVSAISLWEIALKQSIKKLELNFTIGDIPLYCQQMGFSLMPLIPLEVLDFVKLPQKKNHKDPFDRMLVCQCIANGYTLVSKDARMAEYKVDGLECI